MKTKDPVRWGYRLAIGGGLAFVSAWIGISIALFKLFGG